MNNSFCFSFPSIFFAVPFLHLGKCANLQHASHTKSCHSRELLSPSRLVNWHNYWGEFLISLRWSWECRFMSSSSSLKSLPLKIHLSPSSIISSPEDKSANSLLSLSLCVYVCDLGAAITVGDCESVRDWNRFSSYLLPEKYKITQIHPLVFSPLSTPLVSFRWNIFHDQMLSPMMHYENTKTSVALQCSCWPECRRMCLCECTCVLLCGLSV